MQQSPEINELATALAKAQGEMKNAGLNKINPHFKSKYADLPTIREAVIPVLTKHGLAVTQAYDVDDHGRSYVVTVLMHSSGQWLSSRCPVKPDREGPQPFGSASTYARRYSLAAIAGIAAEEDDDANSAQDDNKPANGTARSAKPKQEDEPWKVMAELIKKSIDEAKDSKELDGVMKNATSHLESIKAKSETAYTFLMDRSLKRASVLAQEPPAKKVA